ncbi:MAG: hypothetical protein MJY78_10625 [Fibrobacter sp.]|nr:hypothetical protein [Fibrobacter sp.]
MLGITQKKGTDDHLCGKMIAYAKILPSPSGEGSETPFDEMIKNGLLVLEGDFRKAPAQPNKRKLDNAVDEKLNSLISSMEEQGLDIPENLDIDALRDRLHELNSMEVIPIPARIGSFASEEEILGQDADVYYVGEFIGVNQAHFCLTTLPIFYQAKYREQVKAKEMAILSDVLSQFESGDFMDTEDIQKETEGLFPDGASINTFVGDLSKLLNVRVIPFLLACEKESDYETQIGLFYNFMKSYPQQIDVTRIDHALRELRKQSDSIKARQLLELSCKKISAIYNENAKLAEEIEQEISTL